MTLRIQFARVILIDESVRVRIVNVVIHVVGSLPQPLGIVPKYPIVNRVAFQEIRSS